jgi:hypothetical protein
MTSTTMSVRACSMAWNRPANGIFLGYGANRVTRPAGLRAVRRAGWQGSRAHFLQWDLLLVRYTRGIQIWANRAAGFGKRTWDRRWRAFHRRSQSTTCSSGEVGERHAATKCRALGCYKEWDRSRGVPTTGTPAKPRRSDRPNKRPAAVWSCQECYTRSPMLQSHGSMASHMLGDSRLMHWSAPGLKIWMSNSRPDQQQSGTNRN